MLWLVVFLLVAVAIQARQTAAVLTAGRVARLREERTALEAQRAALERQIRLATARGAGRTARRELGLHIPRTENFGPRAALPAADPWPSPRPDRLLQAMLALGAVAVLVAPPSCS